MARGEAKSFHRQSLSWRSLERRRGLQGAWIAYIRASNTTVVQGLGRVSVRKYARNKRLAFAARQLQARDTIKVIALEIGYRRTAEFTRALRNYFA